MFSKNDLVLYQGHFVLVKLNSGNEYRGILELTQEEEKILLSGEDFNYNFILDDVADIRYVGKVTEYHTREKTIVIDDCFIMPSSEVEKVFPYNVKYEEFEYKVNCHLQLNAKIEVIDVCIEETGHYIDHEIMSGKTLLYKIRDEQEDKERWMVGVYQNAQDDNVQIMEKGSDIKQVFQKDIRDITSVPKTNNEVIIETEDNCSYRGIVNVVRDNYFYLLISDKESERVESVKINFDDLREIRYCGAVTNYSERLIDEMYMYKPPHYFRNREINVEQGSKVSYLAGIGREGYIAKEIDIDEVVHKKIYYGLVISNNRKSQSGKGYIGTTLKRNGDRKGDVVFNIDQLGEEYNFNYNTQYCIVKYTLNGNVRNKKVVDTFILPADEKPDIRYFDNTDAVLTCDTENGNCTITPIWQEEVSYYINKQVDIIYKDGTIRSGCMKGYTDNKETIILEDQEEVISVPAKDIEQIRIYGTVTTNLNNGIFILDIDVYGHVRDGETVDGVTKVLNMNDISVGDKVSYFLGFKEKENLTKIYAYEIRKEKKKTVKEIKYILAYNDNYYWTIEKSDYESGNISCEKISKVYSTYYCSLPDLTQYDYPAEFVYDESGEINSINVLTDNRIKKDKVRMGQIQYYNPNPANPKISKGFIIEWDYITLNRKEREAQGIRDIGFDNIDEELNIVNWSYNVLYDSELKYLGKDDKKDSNKKIRIVKKHGKERKESDSNVEEQKINVNFPDKTVNIPKVQDGEQIAYTYVDGIAEKVILLTAKVDKTKPEEKVEYIYTNEATGEESIYKSNELSEIIPESAVAYRFGVLTGYNVAIKKSGEDKVKGEGIINGIIKFNMNLMLDEIILASSDKKYKTKNVFAQNKRNMLIAYTCNEEGKINRVQKIPEKIISHLQWKKGTVSDFIMDEYRKSLVVDWEEQKSEHFVSELTNSMVSQTMKRLGSPKGMKVYIRTVDVNIAGKKSSYIADIHCVQEDRFIVKDTGNEYLAISHLKDAGLHFKYSSNDISLLEDIASKNASSLQEKRTFYFEKTADGKSLDVVLFKESSEASAEFDLSMSDIKELIQFDSEESLEEAVEKQIENNIMQAERENEKEEIYDYSAYLLQNLLRAQYNTEMNLYRLLLLALENSDDIKNEIEKTFKDRYDKNKLLDSCNAIFKGQKKLNIRRFLSYIVLLEDNIYRQIIEFTKNADIFVEDMKEDLKEFAIKVEDLNIDDVQFFDYIKTKFNAQKDYILEKDEGKRKKLLKEYALNETTKKLFAYLIGEENAKRWEVLEEYRLEASKTDVTVEERRNKLTECSKWSEKILEYPTQITKELIFASGELDVVVDKFRYMIDQDESNIFFGPSDVEFGLVESEIIRDQEYVNVYFQNEIDLMVTEAVIKLEWTWKNGSQPQQLTFTDVIKVGEYSENCKIGIVKIPRTVFEYDEVSLELKMESCKFRREVNGKVMDISLPLKEVEGRQLQLQIRNQTDKKSIFNPYDETSSLTHKSEMFFGRKVQKMDIAEKIYDVENHKMRDHQALMISGQKRCGKSVLIQQLVDDKENKLVLYTGEKEEKLNDTFVIKFSRPRDVLHSVPEEFYYFLSMRIVHKLSKDIDNYKLNLKYNELYGVVNNYYRVFGLNKDQNLNAEQKIEKMIKHMSDSDFILSEEKYIDEFSCYVSSYMACTGKRIIVIIDEFTESCDEVANADSREERENNKEYLLSFIEKFKTDNITTILIGHELMVETLNVEFGLGNAMTKINNIYIENFDREEATQYIIIPFARKFFNYQNENVDIKKLQPFNNPCGQKAIKKMYDLTLGYPYYLTILCKYTFKIFKEKVENYITEKDIEFAMKQFLEESIRDSKYFEALFCERGDDKKREEDIKKYLLKVANSKKTVRFSEEDKIQELLLKRKVLKKEDNAVRINMPLFEEHLKKMSEMGK